MVDIKGLFIVIVVSMLCLLSTVQLYAASYQMHTIKSGETYSKIARDNGIDAGDLQRINNQSSGSLKIGSLIKVKQINDIKVNVNGTNVNFDAQPYIENGHVFIPIRFVSEALNCDSVDWNPETMRATVKAGSKNIVVRVGSDTAVIDEKTVKLDAPVQFYNSRTFVPIRFFSETIGVDSIEWDANSYTVVIKNKGGNIAPEDIIPKYSEEDLYWLSRIVGVEAGSETFEGKVAVANVIINRKNSPAFPNTIKGVIFDTKYGIQFPPTRNGSINRTPSEDSIDAAKKALEGYDNVGQSLYFADPSIKDSWVVKNRKFYKIIGYHAFYL